MASSNMKALLATLAVAGWQNRDRLGELLTKATGQKPGTPPTGTDPEIAAASADAGGLGGLLGGLLGGGRAGKGAAGGLGELIESFKRSGQGEVADSWVQTGPNKEVEEPQLTEALGGDTIDELATQTGLSRDELLSRLKSILPTAIDKLTPEGRLPTEDETSQW